jgi:hypothetical protein
MKLSWKNKERNYKDMVRDKTAAQPGDEAKDVVTGFRGIIVARTTWLHGCDRLSIAPTKLGSDGTPVKEHLFDEDRIEIIKKAKVPFITPAEERLTALPIGAEAKDTITGFKGIIAGISVQLSGDIHVALEPEKLDKDGEPVEIQFFNDTRVEMIKPKPVPKTAAKTSGKDGGPPPRGEGRPVRGR